MENRYEKLNGSPLYYQIDIYPRMDPTTSSTPHDIQRKGSRPRRINTGQLNIQRDIVRNVLTIQPSLRSTYLWTPCNKPYFGLMR